ncbi:glutamate racemase [Leptospira wolffii]|uniref:glutamate racemase n=1 Tax=Leptospira wolffii TaxID=409998 RepID=UPI0010848FAD|nr:aspartate/glutamate racemase family protein [Leptospira wolffii]TGK55231.1 glutamate racemase [Leptospira wolffii]TGK65740.1 glutamate racemase [Leptospira wolffii]TGK70468.1 glutamate racemase [Leptospira wolffii]TGL29996.1 glutamate racemase [Leptospira wolffii]
MRSGEKVPKIGVMDSGMGGLSVLKELLALPYRAEFFYYGDLENAPYGERSSSDVLELTRNVCRFFLSRNVDAILLACNTATSAAARTLRSELEVPVFGMEPAIKPALSDRPGEKIALLATSVTHREEKLQGLKADLGAEDRILHLNCDGLASSVDQGDLGAARKILERILRIPMEFGIRGLVLGCTHYIFLKHEIMSLYPEAILYDGNGGTVRHLVKSLGLDENPGVPSHSLFFSGNEKKERALALGTKLLELGLSSSPENR